MKLLRSFLLVWLSTAGLLEASERPNVLFLAIDDLRPDLGCYGSEIVKSPHIDRLAASGTRFERAYCQQAICGPSRASVLTGLRPDAIQVHGNHTHFRKAYPDLATLPQHFKNHGYHARSMGKIYHGVFPRGASRTVADTFGDEESWSVPTFRPGPRYYYTEEGIEAAKEVYQRIYRPKDPGPDDWTGKLVFGPATEAPDLADEVLYDGQVADRAVQSLQELAQSEEPFFLAVGFIKPHSPYIAPKKYWDLYDPEEIPLADPGSRVTDAPGISLHGSGELRRYTDQPGKGPIPEANQRTVRHAYYACVSYIDAQVGRVLDELEAQGLADNTIVALWSDHGYHLGEKDLWGKTTNFELDTRVPMILRVPGQEPGVSSSLVELVDLYPTLADLAGLPVGDHLQGSSLAPLVKDPSQVVKTAAFSQFSRSGKRGYSIRTPSRRYTEWIDLETGEVTDRLLFDQDSDPGESKNLAPEADPKQIAEMSRLLDRGQGWRMARATHQLTLGWPFTDHLVLQRGQPNRIWGTAAPGAGVILRNEWGCVTAKANDRGRWTMEVTDLGDESPSDFVFESGDEKMVLEKVVFGDVWICSGQSNMRWMLKQTAEAKEAIATSRNPNLRLLHLASTIHPGSGKFPLIQLRSTFADNLYDTEGWKVAGPETVPEFSGVAYHFGRRLQEETGVPIGLIHNAVGGSPMEAWIPTEGGEPNWIEGSDLPEWVAGRAKHNLSQWAEHPALPAPHHPFEPGFLFRAGIDPLTGLGVRGVIWYQGESNATEDGASSPAIDPEKNFETHRRLIESWRTAWNRPELPFYLVQLPGLNREWAPFREVQSKIDRRVPNTHLVVTLDLGHPTNVHPNRKRPVGERLADLALRHEYGKDFDAEAPRWTGWVNRENAVELRFDRPVDVKEDAKVAIAGKDRVFHPVPFTQVNETGLRVSLDPLGSEPLAAIRYAWENDPAATILGRASGLPVAPFRSDNWPLVSKAVKNVHSSAAAPTYANGTSFESVPSGEIGKVMIDGWLLSAEKGNAEIDARHWHEGKQCLRLLGGEKRSITIRPPAVIEKGSILAFQAERWTRRSPFAFRILGRSSEAGEWREIYDGAKEVVVGRAFLSAVQVVVPFELAELKLESTSPEGSGVLVDDLRVQEPKPMSVTSVVVPDQVLPVLLGKRNSPLLTVEVKTEGTLSPKRLTAVKFEIPEGIDHLENLHFAGQMVAAKKEEIAFEVDFSLEAEINRLVLGGDLKPEADLDGQVRVVCTQVVFADGTTFEPEASAMGNRRRIGVALRQLGQDGVNSTRIPGLATTNQGTLIAVYDNRNRGRGDLPGDIDVGMNRSTDGGQTWEPMRVIMDMGADPEWNYDGIGDPAVLVDRVSGTIWVIATWSHGNRSWNGSGPGMEPEETGQLMLTKSDDDGRTWSEPINITKQVKDPKWRFVLQGPGKGITMKDGTLVFPAQYRSENEEPHSGKPFSTLIYSKDRGSTWHIGTGVQINTNEAQLVELGDGSIMINCRDLRGGSRSVFVTRDLGQTWEEHPSSRSALPEPVCMASLIRVETEKFGPLLFFSNPPQRSGRHHMTIKISNDEGMTWPEKWHTLVDERTTAYSCMTVVGEDQVGLLYEAPGELYFVRYSVEELLAEDSGAR